MHRLRYHADFWHCNRCSVQWSAAELAEAREDAQEASPYDDLLDVYREECSRGEPGGGSSGCKMRKKNLCRKSFQKKIVNNEWNVGEDSAYVKKGRPIKLEPLSAPVRVYVKKAFEASLQDMIEASGLSASELTRVVVKLKLEKLSETA